MILLTFYIATISATFIVFFGENTIAELLQIKSNGILFSLVLIYLLMLTIGFSMLLSTTIPSVSETKREQNLACTSWLAEPLSVIIILCVALSAISFIKIEEDFLIQHINRLPKYFTTTILLALFFIIGTLLFDWRKRMYSVMRPISLKILSKSE